MFGSYSFICSVDTEILEMFIFFQRVSVVRNSRRLAITLWKLMGILMKKERITAVKAARQLPATYRKTVTEK